MNSQIDTAETSALIEGYPLSPLQQAIAGTGRSVLRQVSSVQLRWPQPVDKNEVIALLTKRIASQAMLTTRIVTFGQPPVSLQVPGEGRVAWICETSADAFERQLIQPFDREATETLRILMEGDDEKIHRLALLAPTDVTDPDGLVLLLSKEEAIPTLTYQHFSEWALQAKNENTPETVAPLTDLDLGVSLEKGILQQSSSMVSHSGRLGSAEACLAGLAVLGPYFAQDQSESITVSLSTDGRLFSEFSGMAGPFRLGTPLTVSRVIPQLQESSKALENQLDQNALAIATGAASAPVDPPLIISIVTIPDLHPLFSAATLSFRECPAAPLVLSLRLSDGRTDIELSSCVSSLSPAVLADLAKRTADAITRGASNKGCSGSQLAGLAPPALAPISPIKGTIWKRFEDLALDDPTRTALIADRSYSFGEVRDAAERLASTLQKKFGPKGRILLFADRSFGAVVSLLGTLRAGLTPVPVLREYPDERIRHIAAKSDALGAVAEAGEFERASRIMPGKVLPAIGHEPQPMADFAGSGEDEAYILFTSGSTGEPKGVAVRQSSVLNLVDALKDRIYGRTGPGLRLSINAPLAFDSSMKQVFQIILGHTLVPVPAEIRADPEAMIEFAADMQLDALDVTPTILRAMISVGFGSNPERMPKRLLVGGEAFDAALWREARNWRNTDTWNVYGPTEATVNTLVARVKDHEAPTLGYPLAGISVAVVDASGNELPQGAAGELMIAGRGVALGYIGASEKDNLRFSSLPNGVRTYRTGDYARQLADGTIAFIGRRDDQVKVGGQRLELGEIQACLSRQPGVAEAVVLIEKSQEGNPRIVAAVVPREENKLPDLPDAVYVDLPTGHRIASLNASETRYQFREIFEDQIYTDPRIIYPEDAVVFDVGANLGLFSLFVASHIPRAKIYSFEPLAPIREKLANNIARYARNVTILPYGLSDREREVGFTYYPGYAMMSGQRDYADAGAEKAVITTYLGNAANEGDGEARLLADHIEEVLEGRFDAQIHECRLRRLSDVFDENGLDRIDVLKIDVQRAELDVLRGIDERHLRRIRAISMELHDDPSGVTAGRGSVISNMLEQAGFQVDLRQDPLLQSTDRWNLVAWRTDLAEPRQHITIPSTVHRLFGGVTSRSLLTALQAELPPYMVPRALRVVSQIPRTPQGKLDKAAILSSLEEETEMDTVSVNSLPPVGDSSSNPPAIQPEIVTREQPKTEALLSIWREVLRRPQLTERDDFFVNGGDSIRAILMQSKARAAGINITLRDLHARPTVTGLLATTGTSESQPQPTVKISEPSPVSGSPAANEATHALLAIWRDVLRRPQLTEKDDFFVNGGDSIRAILMQSKARAVGINITLRDLHARPTVVGLLGGLRPAPHPSTEMVTALPSPAAASVAPPAPALAVERRWPATGMQRLKLSATAARQDAQVYHNATITPVHLPFSATAFSDALAAIRKVHPILTAHVALSGDSVDFVFNPRRANGDYSYLDISAAAIAEQEQIIKAEVLEEREKSFPLSEGNLVRFKVIKRNKDRFDLLVAEHHAALDGYSLNAIIRELVERFRGSKVETTDDLAVFAAVEAEQNATDRSQASRTFFGERLEGLPFRPLAPPRALADSADMRQVDVLQSQEVFRRLNQIENMSDVSTKGLFFAMNIEALTRALGERPSRIGVVFSLRPEVEGSLLAIGNFLNVLPVPTGPRTDLVEAARQFDRFDRSAFQHKAASFERLAEWFGSAAHFDTVFNFIQFAEPDSKRGDVHETEQRFFAVDAMVPLSVDWDLSGDSLVLGFQYDAKRLDAATVERLASSFRSVVAEWLGPTASNVSGNRTQSISQLHAVLREAIGELPSPSARLSDHALGSLEKVQLARKLIDRTGIAFPLCEFLPLQTLGELEQFVEQKAGNSTINLSFIELTAPRHYPPRLRIVGFQPVGVAGSIFDPWCDLVGDDVSIHALRWPEFEGNPASLGFERFMASLTEAVGMLGNEPMIFVGGCFGAILAYEVACRLKVGPHAMVFIGSGAPAQDARAPLYHEMTDVELKAELVRLKSMPQSFLENEEILVPVFKALRGMAAIATTWSPRLDVLAECPITAVWPQQDAGVSKRAMLDWANLTSSGFKLTEIPGEHAVLVDDPLGVWKVAELQNLIRTH